MKPQISYFFWLCTFFSPQNLFSLSLDEALVITKQNAFELKKYPLNSKILTSKASKIDSIFDPQLSISSQFISDKNQSLSFPENKMDSYIGNVELTKNFSFGTFLKASLSQSYFDVDRPSNPLLTDSVNNGYETNLSFEISQNLLRNFKQKELELQKNILLEGQFSNNLQKKIYLQKTLHEVENLFIQYSFLKQNLDILKKIKKTHQNIYNLLSKRLKKGRADAQMLEEAKYKIIVLDERIYTLSTVLLNTQDQIRYRIYPKDSTKEISPDVLDLEKHIFSFKPSSFENFFELAKKNRMDIKLIKHSYKPLRLQNDLADHKHKPQLNAFISYSSNYLDKQYGDSLANTFLQKKPKFVIGLKLNYTFSDTEYQSKKSEILLEKENISLKEQELILNIKKQLKIQFNKFDSFTKKLAFINQKAISLKTQKNYSQKKFKQARVDQLKILNHQLQLDENSINHLNLLSEQNQIIASIKWICHLYPGDRESL